MKKDEQKEASITSPYANAPSVFADRNIEPSHEEDLRVFRQRLEHDRCANWIKGLPRAAISNAVTAGLTLFLIRNEPGDLVAYGWLFSVLILNIVRLALTPVMQRWLTDGNIVQTKHWLTSTLVISSTIWSLPALAFFPEHDFLRQSILAVALLSVSAGAIMSYTASPRMALILPCFVLVPFTIRCGAQWNAMPIILALLCVLFLTLMFFMERDWSKYIEQNLHLSVHNELLSKNWKAAHHEAVKAINTREKFLREMSHEIRTPLNGIQGMTKLLLAQVAQQGLNRRSLKVIEESSDRLLLLINEMFGEFGEKPEITEAAVDSLFVVDANTYDGEPRGTILIVEDNPVNQMVLALHLEKRGFRIETADSGEKALVLQKTLAFDAVMMDCQMPGVDGFETTRYWRRAEAGKTRTPIIAVTANAVSGDRHRCLEAGMDDYVPKPIDPALLFQKLEYLIANSPDKKKENQGGAVKEAKTELNMKALEALRDFDDGKGEVLNEIIKKFIETTEELIAPYKSHCENQKWEAVRHIAHTVKSSAATVGAMSLSDIAKRMEHNMREKRYDGVMADCEKLIKAYASAQTALRDYLSANKKAA